MQRFTRTRRAFLCVACYFSMTSAMKSQKYVKMTNSTTGNLVCSTDPPSKVLPMLPGREMRCGAECFISSACPYYQFKSSAPIQCEIYSQFPINFESIMNCIGFKIILPPIIPRDCADVSKLVSNVSGVYTVYLGSNNRPVKVYCDMNTSSGGWTVFQVRKDGSVDFYLNWNQYALGFGDVNGEFWIGNFNLNLLTTSKRYKLRVDLTDFDGNTRYAEYDNFVVNSAADNYKLSSVGAYSGTAGNSLASHVGRTFTTYDQNNDGCNSAVNYKGAWWYWCGHHVNLNGHFYGGPTTTFADGVIWYHWTGHYYSLKASMKIKPVD